MPLDLVAHYHNTADLCAIPLEQMILRMFFNNLSLTEIVEYWLRGVLTRLVWFTDLVMIVIEMCKPQHNLQLYLS